MNANTKIKFLLPLKLSNKFRLSVRALSVLNEWMKAKKAKKPVKKLASELKLARTGGYVKNRKLRAQLIMPLVKMDDHISLVINDASRGMGVSRM